MSSSSNFVKSLQQRNARLVLNIGQRESRKGRGTSRGAKHGMSEEQCDHCKAVDCLRKAKKDQFGSILERFYKQDSYRESQMAIGWTEEKCRCLDQLALEDKSCTATRRERTRYENNWKLTTNAQGPVSPIDERDDYQAAVKTIKNLRQQVDQPSNPPILVSYQTRQGPFEERHEAEWKLGQILLLPHQ